MNVTYTTGGSGRAIDMGGAETYLAFQGDIAGHEYSYRLGMNDIDEVNMTSQAVSVPFVGTWDAFDSLLRESEADIASRKPGTVLVNGWAKRAYITGAKHKRSARGMIRTDLTVALVDGFWWRRQFKSFTEQDAGGQEPDFNIRDYSHAYAYGYAKGQAGGTVTTGILTPSKPFIVFYGPVTDPYVTVAGNLYKVTGTLVAGSRIEVDGRDKTVRRVLQDGTVTDKFADAVRGSGEGGGSYIFQPIPGGTSTVAWDGSFGVDVGWYEEVGEVPWSQS